MCWTNWKNFWVHFNLWGAQKAPHFKLHTYTLNLAPLITTFGWSSNVGKIKWKHENNLGEITQKIKGGIA
jgi:hypothetical protein